jgi:(1->4)-alpha-D-glucan 1-alpha-D-glucosylmutase
VAGPAWRATYRLQLTSAFGFAEAAALVPYLAELGVSHLYLSPSLESVSGSTHGYDGTDPTTVSRERGGEAGLRALARTAHDHGLGILLDIVPNHLAASDETPWWRDPQARAEVFDTDPETGWYRRFFDIDGLAGVRQEDPAVFERTHAKVLELVADGVVDGLRIDHPDGLVDPAGYLARLHERSGVPIWVEKILHPGEPLRPWPVAGTVGYEFATDLDALFTDPAAELPLTDLYRKLTGDDRPFDDVALEAKGQQLTGPFRRELDRLAELAPGIAEDDLVRAVTGLGVYRTYVVPAGGPDAIDPRDRALIEATAASPELVARLLQQRGEGEGEGEGPTDAELVVRYQQLTAPVTAKGVEDTAFYRSVRLLAHNEVGGDPGRWSIPVEAFHDANLARLDTHPHALLAATTHDTKRAADTRARLLALTHRPDEWELRVRRWFEVTEPLVGPEGPTPKERWFLFQTLLGSWPLTVDRLEGYLTKAMREAKEHTSWVEPNEAHEAAVLAFARDLLELPAFAADFVPFAHELAMAGEWISVAQTVLRATSPGVCDVYGGDETWFLSLVDPDVRRPVDHEGRRRQLALVQSPGPPTRATAKLHALHHALALRRRRPAPFEGAYTPLDAGPATVAFTRGGHGAGGRAGGPGGPDDAEVAVVVPVRPDPSAEVALPPGRWRDALLPAAPDRDVRGPLSVGDVVGPLGVALWERLP